MNFTEHFEQLHSEIQKFITDNQTELKKSADGQKTLKAANAMLEVAKIGQELEGIKGFGATVKLIAKAKGMKSAGAEGGLTDETPFTFTPEDQCAKLNAEFAVILYIAALRVVNSEVEPSTDLLKNYKHKFLQMAQMQADHFLKLLSQYNQPKETLDAKSPSPSPVSSAGSEDGEGYGDSDVGVSITSSVTSTEISFTDGEPSPLSTPPSTPTG